MRKMSEICTIFGCLKNIKLLQCEQIIYHFKARGLEIPSIFTFTRKFKFCNINA